MSDALKGKRVLELANVLAGPSVGQFCAELGAEVIKVERADGKGDVTRTWFNAKEANASSFQKQNSSYFNAFNWGKKSIALNYATIEGMKLLKKLIARSDIIILSFKPADIENFGLDFENLKSLNPNLIAVYISGYGLKNKRPGYDAIIQAESGFMYLNGEPGGPSLKMPVALMDMLCAHQAKEGLLVALLENKSKMIDVSLAEAAISSLGNQALNYLQSAYEPGKQGADHPNIVPYGTVFKTTDIDVVLAVGTDVQFKKLCSVLQIPENNIPELWKTNSGRIKDREQLKRLLSGYIKNFSSNKLLSKLEENNVPAAPVNPVPEALKQPFAKNVMLKKEDSFGLRSALFQNTDELNPLSPPPKYAEHTKQCIQDICEQSDIELNSLIHKGIIK